MHAGQRSIWPRDSENSSVADAYFLTAFAVMVKGELSRQDLDGKMVSYRNSIRQISMTHIDVPP